MATPRDLNRLTLTNRRLCRVFSHSLRDWINQNDVGLILVDIATENGNLAMLKKLVEDYPVKPNFALPSNAFSNAAKCGQLVTMGYIMKRYPDMVRL